MFADFSSDPAVLPEQLTTARVNGRPVEVEQPHRRWASGDYVPGAPECQRYEPVAVTVSAPISLSLEDVVAVLFDWNMPEEDLADDDMVRWLVAAAVVGFGSLHIETERCALGERTLDVEQVAYLAYCRDRATAVFAAPGIPVQHRQLIGAV